MFTLVARGPQGYKVVQYIDFRYRDLKEGRDGAHLIASVKPFQTLGPEYEMHFWPIEKNEKLTRTDDTNYTCFEHPLS